MTIVFYLNLLIGLGNIACYIILPTYPHSELNLIAGAIQLLICFMIASNSEKETDEQ